MVKVHVTESYEAVPYGVGWDYHGPEYIFGLKFRARRDLIFHTISSARLASPLGNPPLILSSAIWYRYAYKSRTVLKYVLRYEVGGRAGQQQSSSSSSSSRRVEGHSVTCGDPMGPMLPIV